MSGKNIAKQNAMAKSTFFTGQPVFANSASTSTGTKSQDQHGIWRRTLQEVFDAWTHLRMGSYQSGARWRMPPQKGESRSLETTVLCRSTRTWTMATFVFHKDGTTHRARIASYVETKTSGRGLQQQNKSLDRTNSSA